MPLLSKEERQTLTPDEKRKLRKERRAKRREERGPFLGIKWEKMEPIAEELILDIASDVIPGEEKMKEVIDDLAERADDFLEWKGLPFFVSAALEAVDGIIIKAIARGILKGPVQRVYDRMKEEGKLDGEE
jgi:hypothetical protein|tara:strand:- start:738 stop:1130 length:393 start_codon:yes stop_codon:yes gene_type:complete